MSIIIAILVGLLIVISFLFYLYRKAFWILYKKIMNEQEIINRWPIAQYECILIVNIFYNYKFEGRAVDFSRYETQGLIVYNCFHDAKNSPKGITNDGIVSSFYKQAFVYELDDGTFEWEDIEDGAKPAFWSKRDRCGNI